MKVHDTPKSKRSTIRFARFFRTLYLRCLEVASEPGQGRRDHGHHGALVLLAGAGAVGEEPSFCLAGYEHSIGDGGPFRS